MGMRLAWYTAILGLAGCGTIEPVAPAAGPVTDPMQLYMRLTLDHPAVTLSTAPTYDAIQLTAIPRDALDNPMTGLPVPTFVSTDTTKVQVTAQGLVTAVGTGDASIIATLASGPVSHVDTALITVTNLTDPPKLASFSIHPAPPDSAIWPWQPYQTIGSFFILRSAGLWDLPQLVGHAVDSLDSDMPDLLVAYTSLDPAIATVDRRTGNVTIVRPGEARFVATTTAYGITKSDTVTYTVTSPAIQDIAIEQVATAAPDFVSPVSLLPVHDIRIAQYGLIVWYNFLTDDTVDVTFDDPTNVVVPPPIVCESFAVVFFNPAACSSGQVLVPPTPDPDGILGTIQLRQFPEVGVYPYHSARLGIAGRVIVEATPAE